MCGSPTQVPGYVRTSGMYFDGVDDALMVDISTTNGTATNAIRVPENNGSGQGLWPFEPPQYFGKENYGTDVSETRLGFLMRLKMDEFPGAELPGTGAAIDTQKYHWVLASAWEGSGASFTNYTRLFHISVVNPSSIKLHTHQSTLGSYFNTNFTTYPHNLPSGEWFTIGLSWWGNIDDSLMMIIVSGTGPNSTLYTMKGSNVSSITLRPSGAQIVATTPSPSKIVFGCLGQGRYPSGFFKGSIEEIMWFNGGMPKISDYYAFHSGNIQQTRPEYGSADYPYNTAYWKFEGWKSGIAVPGSYGWIAEGKTGLTWWEEELNDMHVIVSGTTAIDPGSGKIASQTLPAPGTFPGLYGVHHSGIGWNAGLTAAAAYRALIRQADYCPPYIMAPPFGMTIMYWMKVNAAATGAINIGGFNNISTASQNVPWNTQWNALGVLTNVSRIHFGDVQGAGSNSDRTLVGFSSANSYASGMWRHVAHVVNFNTMTHYTFVSGLMGGLTENSNSEIGMSGMWLKQCYAVNKTYFQFFGRAFNATAEQALSGIVDEFIIVGDVLPSSTIYNFYTEQSGFLQPPVPLTSGIIGGYTYGIPPSYTSGMVGGYIIVGQGTSGMVGGYISGAHCTSGMVGCYIITGIPTSGTIGGYISGLDNNPASSGLIGGYMLGMVPSNGTIGGYISGFQRIPVSGMQGGYTRGVEIVDQEASFVAFFNVIGRDKKEFDAQVQVYMQQAAEFDARATLYINEQPPIVNIFLPSTHQSGNTTPVTYHFEATASGQQSKNIYQTFWFFTDIIASSGSTITSSGTYATDHTFDKSGIFNVIFVAIDENGLVSSDRRIINTASGYNLPTISLTASPESGIAPLSVGFSGVINSAPSPIVDKFIYFGDGTRSASTASIYKLYPVIGEYIPVFRVRDASGFIVTDSTVIGVNN